MNSIRALHRETDLPVVKSWWAKHGAIAVPDAFLPQGFVISSAGVDIAAAFLYLDAGGKLAMIEYLTTNPAISHSRELVEDVKQLITHVEEMAVAQGCEGIVSLVVPGTGEDRLMKRMGYYPPDGPAHAMYCKRLKKD